MTTKKLTIKPRGSLSFEVSFLNNWYRLRPCPSFVIFIFGCHPWMRVLYPQMTFRNDASIHGRGFSIHGWYPWKRLSSMDEICSFMYLIVIHHILLARIANFSSKCPKLFLKWAKPDGWANLINGWRNLIYECILLMPFMDVIYGWRNLIHG